MPQKCERLLRVLSAPACRKSKVIPPACSFRSLVRLGRRVLRIVAHKYIKKIGAARLVFGSILLALSVLRDHRYRLF